MGNILRMWNENRRGIITAIVAIALLILIIQILNQIAKQQSEIKINESIIELTEDEKKLPTESIIGGRTIPIETTKSNVSIIEEFVEKCNKGSITEAYNMLTNECKEVLFPEEQNFKAGYYDMIFASRRIADMEQFLSGNNRYTYRVKFYTDVLSTGTTANSSTYQDYITIDENSNNGKLNINSFIYKNDINKYSELNGIKITILSKEVYKENEKYQIRIDNNTNKRILIDTRANSSSIYLIGDNNVTYKSNISEIAKTLYEIPSNMGRTYKLRFNKIYSSGVGTKGIVFSDIVEDCEAYKENPNVIDKRLQIGINM